MTTIVGIQANEGLDGIVIAADRQLNFVSGDNKKEEDTGKKQVTKLLYGDYWVFGSAGIITDDVERFQNMLKGYVRVGSSKEAVNNMLSKAVNNHFKYDKDEYFEKNELDFEEITKLNARLRRNSILTFDSIPEFMLAANLDRLLIEKRPSKKSTSPLYLFHIDEFGNLRKPEVRMDSFQYLCIGTGEDKARQYIETYLDKSDEETVHITLPKAIKLAIETLEVAESDPHTGGPPDLVVLTKEGTDYVGKRIRDAMKEAKDRVVTDWIGEYEKLQKAPEDIITVEKPEQPKS